MVRPSTRPIIRSKKQKVREPETADEFLDAAVEEEDQGDRWLGSDLAKAVRFYQRSYILYMKALDKPDNGQIRQDALYNIARMQYLIYSKIIRPGFFEEIAGSVMNNSGSNVVEFSITNIIENHRAISTQTESLDVLFNYAQVLTEAGEELENQDWFRQALQVFDKVYSLQKIQLVDWVQSLSSATGSGPSSGSLEEEREVQRDALNLDDQDMTAIKAEEAVVPSTILETLLAYLNCLTEYLDVLTVYELHENEELVRLSAFLVGEIAQLLEQSSVLPEHLQITTDERIEALIAVAKHMTSLELTKYKEDNGDNPDALLNAVKTIWNDPLLAITTESVEKPLQESDGYMEVANTLGTSNVKSWEAYNAAIDVIQQALSGRFSGSDKIRLCIQRGDIEFSRSRLQVPAAIKNRELLQKNACTFYRNATNLQSLLRQVKLLHQEASIKIKLLMKEPMPVVPKFIRQDLEDLGYLDL